MNQTPEDDTSSLERARERLYEPAPLTPARNSLSPAASGSLPHAWEEDPLRDAVADRSLNRLVRGKKQMRLASVFFISALLFFIVALSSALYIFYVGGNSVSVDKVSIDVQGPTSVAGGDTVPLSVTITNTNAVAIRDATVEIAFPNSTRSADNVLLPYPRYTENLGTLESGARVTRSVRAVLFGGEGQNITLPVSVSYIASGSNAVFVKKNDYPLTIATTPLSISVNAVTEIVSGQPMTITLSVRSNANVPISNVVVNVAPPFGFSVQSSSQPLVNSTFVVGTLAPGATKTLSLTGTLAGQENEQRVFHFTVGTAKSAQDQSLGVTYMTQEASIALVAPFILTTLAINNDPSGSGVVSAGTLQNLTVSYRNTLSTTVTNAIVSVALSGTGIDYSTIETRNGFYRSADHTVVFSQDTDPSLAVLSPGASGFGSLTFSTLPANALAASPSITLTTSVSGTRVGQTNVPEEVTSSASKTVKVATAITPTSSSLYSSGVLGNSGPIPPRVGQTTTYTILWNVRTFGSAVAGNVMSTTLPNYVSYTGLTAGRGSFSFDPGSRTVTWNIGDLSANTTAQGAFQVSIAPSASQRGMAPPLTTSASYSGYDRYAGVQVNGVAAAVSTETLLDPGYTALKAVVQ